MSQRRFLVDPATLDNPTVTLPPDEAAHALRVLRLGQGDAVELLDGDGRLATATISQIKGRQVQCTVSEVSRPDPPSPRLVVCLGLLKNPAMDLVAVKLTELMADQVRPFTTPRTVAKAKGEAKTQRWQRLAAQSLKQCGATLPPQFFEPAPLAEVLAAAPAHAARLLLHPQPNAPTLASAFNQAGNSHEVWLAIGPEGGFAEAEVTNAPKAGFTICTLPGATLRAETAVIATAAIIRFGGR